MAWHALPAEAACTRLRVDPLRGLDEAEAAARRIQRERGPSMATIEQLDGRRTSN